MVQFFLAIKRLPILVCIGVISFTAGGFAADDTLDSLEQKESFQRKNSLEANVSPTLSFQGNSMVGFSDGKENSLRPLSGSPESQKKANPEEQSQEIFHTMQMLVSQINDAHQEGNVKKIFQAYQAFNACEYEEKEWERLGQTLGIHKWPSQTTWKEAVGGDLFFPKQAMDWEVTHTETYRLERIDHIWAFAIGAKFKHPFSTYYLAWVLDKIHTNSTDIKKPDLFCELYDQAFNDLEQCQETPDLCYVLGRSCVNQSDLMYYKFNHKNAIEWHAKGMDLKNRYQILRIRKSFHKVYTAPTLEEYLEIARSGYKLGYLQAANVIEGVDKKFEVLHEAVERDYPLALLSIGILYENLYEQSRRKKDGKDESFLEEARKHYQEAGKSGVLEGYIMLGKTYVGNSMRDSYEHREQLRLLPPETIEKAILSFKEAGEAHHPEGWDYLASLYLNLYQQAKEEVEKNPGSATQDSQENQNKYQEMFYQTLTKGIALGSQWAYHELHYWYSQEVFEALIDEYGYAPQEKAFCETIEKFLEG